MTTKTKSPQQVKAELARSGKSAADLAREMGFPKHLIYRVLSGAGKNLRGDGHKVAVMLGIKDGEIAQ